MTDAAGSTTGYAYDLATNTTTSTNSSTLYNQYSEPVSTTDELGNVRTFNYDANYLPPSTLPYQGCQQSQTGPGLRRSLVMIGEESATIQALHRSCTLLLF